MQPASEAVPVPAEQAGTTLAAVLRLRLPGQTWTQVRNLIAGQRVKIDDALCMDPARRVSEGDLVEILSKPEAVHRGATVDGLVIRHLDDDVVVVEKASGVNTVRHPTERNWTDRRRELSPTLEDLTMRAMAEQLGRAKHKLPRLRIVQRLDKDTSGLVVFARSIPAERSLGRQFHAHTVLRKYLAIAPGFLKAQTFKSWLVQDRGDGRRGSGSEGQGKLAVTHVEVIERLPRHTILGCQLENIGVDVSHCDDLAIARGHRFLENVHSPPTAANQSRSIFFGLSDGMNARCATKNQTGGQGGLNKIASM